MANMERRSRIVGTACAMGGLIGVAVILIAIFAPASSPPQQNTATVQPENQAGPAVKPSREAVLADVNRLLALNTQDSTVEAMAEMTNTFGLTAINADPELKALDDRAIAAADAVSKPDQAQDYVERVNTYWLPMVKGISAPAEPTSEAIENEAMKFDEIATALNDGEKLLSVPGVSASRKRLRAALVSRQVAIFPVLRKAYAKTSATALWEANMEVKSGGAGNRAIHWVGAVFADNSKIQEAEEAVLGDLLKLRFRTSTYQWIPEANGAQYTLQSPSDSDVGSWTGEQFDVVR